LVIFLDNDDIWHPEHLRILREALMAHPACGYSVSGYRQFIDGQLPVFDTSDHSVAEVDPWDLYPTYGFARTPGTTLFRRETVAAAGAWNPEYSGMEDHSLWLRGSLLSPVAWCGGKTLAYRRHPDSLLSALYRSPENYLATIQRVFDDLMHFALSSSVSTERKEIIKRRNAYIKDSIAASFAIQAGRRTELEQALRRLHEGLLREPRHYSGSLLLTLVVVAAMPWESKGAAACETCFLALLDAYPGEFSGLKKLLVYAINNYGPGPRLYLRHFAHRLWDLERMYPLAITTVSSLRQWYRASVFEKTLQFVQGKSIII
jgi:hypothetical protein